MVGLVADYLKVRRHRRGRHVLFVGSGAKIPPREISPTGLLHELAAARGEGRFDSLPAERRPVAQLEAFAHQVPDQAERCRQGRPLLEGTRPSEGHVRLAGLIKAGYFPAIFSMEPHALLEQALHNNFLEPGSDYNLVVLGVEEPEALRSALHHSSRITVVKSGGDLEHLLLPLTEAEIAAHLEPYQDLLREAFQRLVTFTAYTDRDRPFLDLVPHEGGKIFWINPTIPLSDQAAFQELRTDEPQTAEYHKLQPEVTSLLASRQSQRHLLAREAGTFNEFFAALGEQLKRHARRRGPRRRDLSVLRGGPYRFLDYFDVDDDEFYFGREQDVENLLELAESNSLAVLFGQSAIGKTSLLCAGLMARLRQLDEEQSGEGAPPLLPVYMSCGDDPEAALRRALLGRAETEGLALPDQAKSGSCLEMAQALAEAAQRHLLLIVDQFAQIFVRVGATVRDHFVGELSKYQQDERLHLLISVREDYLGELFELRQALPGLMANLYRLRRLSREQAESAITKPAVNFGLQIERDLTQRLLEDLAREGVEPAQLQIVMYRLYEEMEPPSRLMTQRLYDQLGGTQKILAGYLDHALVRLPLSERTVARALLRRMAAASELRVRLPAQRLVQNMGQDRAVMEKVLAHLVDHRLLRLLDEGPSRSYELIHEYLGEEIKKWLGRQQLPPRDVQDLLTRQLSNYEKFGQLIGTEELRALSDNARELSISAEELELILRSAAFHDVETNYWFGRSHELGDRRDRVFVSLLSDESPQTRQVAFAHLPRDLSASYVEALTAGLEDPLPEVKQQAAQALRKLQREIVALLQSGKPAAQRLAVQALGRLGLRRHTHKIIAALSDDDPELTALAVQTLRSWGGSRALRELTSRLRRGPQAPWAVAAVLGRLSDSEQGLEQLRRRAGQQPTKARLLYALAQAEIQARNYDQALEALQQAQEHCSEEPAATLLRELSSEVQQLSQRAEAGTDRWVTFAGSAQHQGYASVDLKPPLQQIWATRTGGPVVASPVVGRAAVYVGSRDGRFYALGAARGEVRWTVATGGRIEGAAAVGEDAVFFGCTDQNLYAVDQANGHLRWRQALEGPVRAACTIADDYILVGDLAGNLSAVSQAEGHLRWRFPAEGEILAAPAAAPGRVVFGSWDARLYALDLESGQRLWQTSVGGPLSAAPTVGESLVWCGSEDGHLYALSLETGKVVWTTSLGGRVRSSPALVGQQLIVGSGDGGVYCLDQETGEIRWRVQTDDEVLASAAVAKEVAYLGSKDGSLYALATESGEVLWQHSSSYGVYSSPALADDTLFIGVSYYYVAAFRSVN